MRKLYFEIGCECSILIMIHVIASFYKVKSKMIETELAVTNTGDK